MTLLAVGIVSFFLGALLIYFWRGARIAELSTRLSVETASKEKIVNEFRSAASDAARHIATDMIKDLRQVKTEADSSLDNKKNLIDQQLAKMSGELGKVTDLVSELEKDREAKFGQLSNALENTNKQTASLLQTTGTLREALANSRARGQWGERMAEDVLRLAGFVENLNFVKQRAIEGTGSKPDFTFLMPKGLKLNMDVKFPYDNYIRFLDSKTDQEKEKSKADFFRDIKAKLKEVTSRDYINPGQNTVDYVLLFVPNEQIFSFIHEEDPSVLDTGLKNNVIFCSPITLFAVLAVIRQAVDNFSLEQTSNEILSLLGSFKNQWIKFMQKFETLGKRLDDAQKEYQALTTTRKTQLERPLNKSETLRAQKGLVAVGGQFAEDPELLEDPEFSETILPKHSDLLQ